MPCLGQTEASGAQQQQGGVREMWRGGKPPAALRPRSVLLRLIHSVAPLFSSLFRCFVVIIVPSFTCFYHGCSFYRRTVPVPRTPAQERNRRRLLPHQVPRLRWARSAHRHPRHRRGSGGPRHAGTSLTGRLVLASAELLTLLAEKLTGRRHLYSN